MQTIQINNPEAERYIDLVYKNNRENLVNDFLLFIKTEIIKNDLKKGFDEVQAYKDDKLSLTDAKEFLRELKSAN